MMSDSDDFVRGVGHHWTIIFRYTEGESSGEDLQCALKDILTHTLKNGLSSYYIDRVSALLLKLEDGGDALGLCVQVLYLLIPNEPLTVSQLDELLKWFEVSYGNNSVASKYFTFWLLACLQVDIISKEYLQTAYYYNLLNLLLSNPRDDSLSLLLTRLTKPSHVKEIYFTKLYDCYNTFANARKYLVVLLHHYAEIMPEVSNNLKIKKLVQPRSLKISDRNMKKTLDRILLNVFNISLDNTININEGINNTIKSSFFNVSPVYELQGGIRITDLDSLEAVSKYYDSVEVPDNIISLLGFKSGQYYIALSSTHITKQLEEQIEAILNGLLNNHPRPSLDLMGFLNSLVETQATCSQGMPVVSKFLSVYVIGWDGNKFKDAIFGLIPWFCFNSFKELDTFMKNLFNVYVCMTLEGKISTIQAFGELYTNLWISFHNKEPIPFIKHPPAWARNNIVGVMESLTKYFHSFVYTGLVAHGADPAFLTQALVFYYKIFQVEKRYDFAVCSLMPQMLVLLCQTSSCISVLNLLCKILTLYLKDRDGMVSDNIEFLHVIKIYCTDTVDILLYGVGGKNIETLSFGCLFSETELAEFKTAYCHVTNLLSITKHFAFMPVLNEIAARLKINVSSLKPEDYVDILDHIAPDCGSLVREIATI